MAAPVNNRIRLNKNGFSLIEVLIALFILAVVGVAFLITLQYALKANMLDDANTTAESLARSQLEYEKGQAYWSATAPWVTTYDFDAGGTPLILEPAWVPVADYSKYAGFIIQVIANPVHITDDGIQIITVTVSKTLTLPNGAIWDVHVTMDGYKVHRLGSP